MEILYKKIGSWWADRDIDLIQLEDGKIYALHGWNGEGYLNCWEVSSEHDAINPDKTYSIYPLHDLTAWSFEEDAYLTDSGEEWDGIYNFYVYVN